MKKLVIKIGYDFNKEVKRAFLNPSRQNAGTHTLFLKSASDLYEILAPKRLELLLHLVHSQNRGQSVSRLAHELKRKQAAVSRDLAVLEKHELIVKNRQKQSIQTKSRYQQLVLDLA